jgi:hypothetical protein
MSQETKKQTRKRRRK